MRSGLRRVSKSVRTKGGTSRRSYWIRSKLPSVPKKAKIALGFAGAALGVAAILRHPRVLRAVSGYHMRQSDQRRAEAHASNRAPLQLGDGFVVGSWEWHAHQPRKQ